MATNYYPLLFRAIQRLDNNTPEARHAIYERARQMVDNHLRSISARQDGIKAERAALEDAIWQIEMETSGPTNVAPLSQQRPRSNTSQAHPNSISKTMWSGRRTMLGGSVALLILLAVVVGWFFTRSGASLNGLIMDNLGKPVAGVSVSILNTNFKTITDRAGNYRIEYIPGRFEVRFEKEGYEAASLILEPSSAATFPVHDVTMARLPFVQNAEDSLKQQNFDAAVNSLDAAIRLFPKEASTHPSRSDY